MKSLNLGASVAPRMAQAASHSHVSRVEMSRCSLRLKANGRPICPFPRFVVAVTTALSLANSASLLNPYAQSIMVRLPGADRPDHPQSIRAEYYAWERSGSSIQLGTGNGAISD